MKALRTLSNVLDTAATWIMSASIVLMCICLVMLIFGRNLFDVSFPALEEISRFTLVWVTFIGASIAYKRNEHMSFDFLLVRFPPGLQRIVKIIREVILLALVFVMVFYGIELVWANLEQTSMQAMIPICYVYVVFAIAGSIMFVHGLNHIAGILCGDEEVFADKVALD